MNKLYRDIVIANIKNAINKSEAADNYDNRVLKERAREIFITELLQPYLNPTMGTCTGIVIDSDGNHSNQIDVIIFDRNVIPPSMLSTDEGVIPSESVLARIEIKSKLTISELKKAVNNARSLKTLHPYFNEIASNHNYKNSPAFYLFAYYSYY